MSTIMCTRRLWKVIGGRGTLPARHPGHTASGRLGAWSACEVPTSAGHVVVGVEESTYLTAVCPMAPLPEFGRVFAASVGAVLEDLGLPLEVALREAAAIAEDTNYARNDNRSLLGSVNDVSFHAQVLLERARAGDLAAIARVQRELNEMPHVHREPAFPSQAVRLLLSSARGVH